MFFDKIKINFESPETKLQKDYDAYFLKLHQLCIHAGLHVYETAREANRLAPDGVARPEMLIEYILDKQQENQLNQSFLAERKRNSQSSYYDNRAVRLNMPLEVRPNFLAELFRDPELIRVPFVPVVDGTYVALIAEDAKGLKQIQSSQVFQIWVDTINKVNELVAQKPEDIDHYNASWRELRRK